MEELKEFCVVCLRATLSASLYCTVHTRKEHEFKLADGTHVQIPQGGQHLNHYVAGRPGHFIEIMRTLGEAAVLQVQMDNQLVGVWAKLEWFGLRICPQHIWDAEELWKAGGNRNWRP